MPSAQNIRLQTAVNFAGIRFQNGRYQAFTQNNKPVKHTDVLY
jgi:hypothetical protein